MIEEEGNLQIEIANLSVNQVDNHTPHPLIWYLYSCYSWRIALFVYNCFGCYLSRGDLFYTPI